MTATRAASIRARRKQHPETSKQDFNLTLTQYGLERLLYRLSISEHAARRSRADVACLPQGHGRRREASRSDLSGYDQHPHEGQKWLDKSEQRDKWKLSLF